MKKGKKEVLRTLSEGEVLARFGKTDLLPIRFSKNIDKKLKTNLIVPPKYQCYSLAIEYISDWFYKKWPDHFFHHKYLDASHVLEQLRTLTTRELIVINKPASHIKVDEDQEFNRNNIDLYNLGATLYSHRAMAKDSFFIDREKEVYIALSPKQVKLQFDFSIRISTKSIQDDIAELCEMMFRANGSQKHYIGADFPVPKELIGQLACDLGMCNEDGEYNVYKMLNYLNMHSRLPFLYKFNTATGAMDYFIRLPDLLVYIKTSGVTKEQAVYKNMSATDFIVKFSSEVRFPAIKFFAYYSLKKRESLHSITTLDGKSFLYGITSLTSMPPKNDKGWPWDYRQRIMLDSPEELKKIKNKQLITINITDLCGELKNTIEYTKSIALNPSMFIDIQAFNYVNQIKLDVDWGNMTLTFKEPLETAEVYLVFYLDKNYIHSVAKVLKKYDEYRMNDINDHIGPLKKLGTNLPNEIF